MIVLALMMFLQVSECVCCTIKNTRSVRVFRHIPKGACIQTAEALSTIIKDCVSGDADLLSWWKHLFFGCTALAIPDTSGNDPTSPSLTTIVKRQSQQLLPALWTFFLCYTINIPLQVLLNR